MSRGIHPQQFRRYVIRPTLRYLGVLTPGLEELLFATVAHESLGGRLLHQMGGRANGAYQIEPATHDDLWINYLKYRPRLANKIRALGSQTTADETVTNLKYATAIAYCVYARAKDPIPTDPKDIWELASYWKVYYNTYKGAGTLRKFVRDYGRWT